MAVPQDLGQELLNLWLAEPAPDADAHDDWDALREAVGERPGDPGCTIIPRQYLPFIRPGEKILIIRKVGGLGDVLHCSLLLTEILRQHPDCPLTFATARKYFELFAGEKRFKLMDQDDVFRFARVKDGEIIKHGAGEFDVIEDVSTPCFNYESRGNYFGWDKIKWRPRVEIWSEWIGLKMDYEHLESPVVIRPEEIAAARAKYWRDDPRPKIAMCPTASAMMRNWDKVSWLPVYRSLLEFADVTLFGTDYPGSVECGGPRDYVAAILAADCTLTTDSAATNICGIWKRPAVCLYGITHGPTYVRHYPTVQAVQCCDTPCCNVKGTACKKRTPCCHSSVSAAYVVGLVKEKLGLKVVKPKMEDKKDAVKPGVRRQNEGRRLAQHRQQSLARQGAPVPPR